MLYSIVNSDKLHNDCQIYGTLNCIYKTEKITKKTQNFFAFFVLYLECFQKIYTNITVY